MVYAVRYFFFYLCLIASAAARASDLPVDVLLRQSGQDVTFADVDAFAETIPAKDRAKVFDSPKRIEQVLQNLLNKKLVAEDARRHGLGVDPIANNGGQLSDEELYRLRMEQIRDPSRLPDLSLLVEETYSANKSAYKQPGRTEVQFIAVKVPRETERSEPAAEQILQARQAIEEIASEIGGDAAKFDAVASNLEKKYVKGLESSSGTMADVISDRYPDALREAARKLSAPGDLSPPVETVDSMYLLKLVSREPDRQLSFEEAKDGIIERKRVELLRREVDEYLGSLRTTPMEVNIDAVDSLRRRYRPGSTGGDETQS